MFGKTDTQWEHIKERYRQFWKKENTDRPLLFITSDIENANFMPMPDDLEQMWLDTEQLLRIVRNNLQNKYYAGEAYPYYMPNVGPDILGAILGCDLILGKHSTWADHCVDDWSKLPPLSLDENNKWFKRIVELTERFVEDAKGGDYIVGLTDLHPGLDALTALRGTERLCMDLIDDPETITKRLDESFIVYKEVLDRLFPLVQKYQGGTTHWLAAWHDGRWNNVSCDFMCTLSGDMFDEFVSPEIDRETELLEASIFHLDGEQAARHIDKLLNKSNINGIQWVFGAGRPTASYWLPLLQKIQAAGKNLHLEVQPHELEFLCKNLRPEGALFTVSAKTPQEADSLVELAKEWTGSRH